MTVRTLMLVGDFVEDYEVMVPFQALQAVGVSVDAVCPGKGKGEFVRTAIHDFEGDQTYSEKPGHRFTLNAEFSSVNASDYAALILPGGRAPEYLRLRVDVNRLIQEFLASGKPIAALCHGPQLLINFPDDLRGKRLSAYPAVGPELRAVGAEYVELPIDGAMTDLPFITGPAWPAHPAWIAEILKALKISVSTQS